MTYLFSLLGSAVLLGCTVQSLRELTGARRLTWLPAAAMLLSLVPLGELSLGRWIHSFTGFLSLPLLVLLAWYSIKPLMFRHVSDHQLLHRYWWLMVIMGSLYFPASMGMGDLDPHAIGWQPGFVWIPVCLAVAMIGLGQYWLAGLVVVSMLAWQGQWFGTTNGWSYLIDPIAVGMSALSIIASKIASSRIDRIATEQNATRTPSDKTMQQRAKAVSTAASKAA